MLSSLPPPLDLVPLLLRGAVVTLELAVLASLVGLGMSFVAGLARTARWFPIRVASTLYVEIFRGTSGLVQIFFFFFVLPIFGLDMTPVEAGVLALGLNFGAYGSEVVRAAVQSVDRGQREAAIALNMTDHLIMRRVILPQAVIAMLPSFGNLAVEMVKATSLVSIITLPELAFTGKVLALSTQRYVQVYSLVLVLYFAIGFPLSRLLRWLEKRIGQRLQLGRAPSL